MKTYVVASSKEEAWWRYVSRLATRDLGVARDLAHRRGLRVWLVEEKTIIEEVSDARCTGDSCGYQEPHKHGFACDNTCTDCGGHYPPSPLPTQEEENR